VLVSGGSNGTIHLNTAELYDPATGTFTATAGNMTAARNNVMAALLPNGKVLVTGGSSASADLYDPATRTFTATGAMTTARQFQKAATLLPNGKVLIAGGHSPFPFMALNTAELYDPGTGTFTATGNMNAVRVIFSAALLPNGKVLIADGENNTADLYEPATGTFTPTGTTAATGEANRATLLPNGKVLITGGYNGSYLDTAELYDVGLGYTDARRPVIATGATLVQSGAITITGSGFRGDTEASGGSGTSSPTNHPLLHLQRMDNDQTLVVSPGRAWSDTSFTSTVLSGLANGYYRVTIITNAIPSVQRLMLITDFGAPASFSATATSGSEVALTWLPVDAATGYEVHRSTSLSGPYTLAATTTGTSTTDAGLTANITYLYKVLATGSGGPSGYSAIDPATTVVFADASLDGVVIKAIHFTQLRTAVNGMRTAANLAAFAFTAPAPSAGTLILRQHVIDLRTGLDSARSALGLLPIDYTNQVITTGITVMRPAHVTELRAGTR
jgi:hypothetical protein